MHILCFLCFAGTEIVTHDKHFNVKAVSSKETIHSDLSYSAFKTQDIFSDAYPYNIIGESRWHRRDTLMSHMNEHEKFKWLPNGQKCSDFNFERNATIPELSPFIWLNKIKCIY